MQTKEWMWAQWGREWCVSEAVTVTWKTNHIPDSPTHSSHIKKMKSTLISSFTQISGLQPGNCILSSILASMHLKQRWQYWSISKAVPSGFHEWLHRNRINTICKFLRIYWTNMRLKVTISWITSLPVMKHSITSTGGNPWSGNMWIPWGRRSWICSPQ